ncbi:DUF2062 domain-containing protein [Undibacterium cyanobacteriorum]|uniref:DUF2062 domain-containing protein n=1 Tax=Undibacterium cyanobacteriorum TaxID=3073561 RepID=A0ABY9RHF2_9BURK|nr:DUF2062 domain-containing protein [Undibacterium sp. 20NA77.5]WMW80648.1 DUF2062 domain-containing protein [Undibacterium sp. 20NA77.5]
MPKKFLRRILPDRQTIERIPISRRFTHHFDRSSLWRVEREAVAWGLAAGVFCGMIPGPLQMIAAISLAFFFRLNLPMAVVGTFLTNPLTIVPIYMAAYSLGQWLLGLHGADTKWSSLPALPETDWQAPLMSIELWWQWVLDLGLPWVIGMVVLAMSLALSSYLLMQLVWRASRYWNLLRLQALRRQTSSAERSRSARHHPASG